MSFQDIRVAIKTRLESLTGPGNPIAFVYDYHKLGLAGYPSATFEPSSLSSQFLTTRENERTYVFDIVIHQELESITRDEAIASLVTVSDAVIDMFDRDYSLGGAIEYMEAVPAEFGEIATPDGIIAYAKIMLRCHKLCLTI